MNSPETPGALGPAMDPGLRELYGTTDKDLSHAAAARRAAGAMAAKLPASRGPPGAWPRGCAGESEPAATGSGEARTVLTRRELDVLTLVARPEEHLIYVPEESHEYHTAT